ncbi:unnamed protein product [Diplocarpon coronariae]
MSSVCCAGEPPERDGGPMLGGPGARKAYADHLERVEEGAGAVEDVVLSCTAGYTRTYPVSRNSLPGRLGSSRVRFPARHYRAGPAKAVAATRFYEIIPGHLPTSAPIAPIGATPTPRAATILQPQVEIKVRSTVRAASSPCPWKSSRFADFLSKAWSTSAYSMGTVNPHSLRQYLGGIQRLGGHALPHGSRAAGLGFKALRLIGTEEEVEEEAEKPEEPEAEEPEELEKAEKAEKAEKPNQVCQMREDSAPATDDRVRNKTLGQSQEPNVG